MDTKVCISGRKVEGCGRDLPLDQFRMNADGSLQPQCKDCWRRQRRLRKNRPEEAGRPLTQVCSACGKERLGREFSYEPGSGGKLRADCNPCRGREYAKNYSKKIQERNAATTPPAEGEKTCPGCAKVLPLIAFYPSKRTLDGRSSRCHECSRAGMKLRREKRGNKPKACLKCEKEFIPENRECYCPPCRSKIQGAEEKLCHDGDKVKGCGQLKPVSEFYTNSRAVDGLSPQCKACVARYNHSVRTAKYAPVKQYKGARRAARDGIRQFRQILERRSRQAASKIARARDTAAGVKVCHGTKRNPGCGKTKPLKSFGMIKSDPNRRVSRCVTCQRRTRDKAKVKASIKAARKRNPGKFRARERLREARQIGAAPKWLTLAQRQEIFQIYEERDRLRYATGVKHHVDHIIPLRGKEEVDGHVIEVWGLHVPWNLRAIPGKDNQDKSNKFLRVSEELFAAEMLGALILDANAPVCEPGMV